MALTFEYLEFICLVHFLAEYSEVKTCVQLISIKLHQAVNFFDNVLDKIENKDPFLTRRLDVDGVRFFNIPYSFLKHNNIFFEEYSPQQLLF